MKLYSYFLSSASYRVRIALNLKGLKYDYVGVNLRKSEQHNDAYLKINPQGLVPLLELDNGGTIHQSTAILEFMEEQYPTPALYPTDAMARGNTRAVVNVIACDIQPLNNLRVQKYLKKELGVSDEQKTSWYHHWIAVGFGALEAQLKASPYCMGESVTMADVYLVPQVYNALRFEQDMTAYPKIMGVYKDCNEVDAFVQAAPEKQSDAPSI